MKEIVNDLQRQSLKTTQLQEWVGGWVGGWEVGGWEVRQWYITTNHMTSQDPQHISTQTPRCV